MSKSRLIFTKFSDTLNNGITTFEVRANVDGQEVKYTSLPFKDSKLTDETIIGVARLAFETIFDLAKKHAALPTEGPVDMEVFCHQNFRHDCRELDIPAAIFIPAFN